MTHAKKTHDRVTRRAFLSAWRRRNANASSEGAMDSARVAVLVPALCAAVQGLDCCQCIWTCPLGVAGLRFADGLPQVGPECNGCGQCAQMCETVNGVSAFQIIPRAGAPRPASITESTNATS